MVIQLPGDVLFDSGKDELKQSGLLNDFDWDKYNVYNPKQMYRHPTLSWDTIDKYYRRAYRKMILLNPSFYYRRLLHGLRSGRHHL